MSESWEFRVRFARPPAEPPPWRCRIVDAWRVLVGEMVAVPAESGPQYSEWSRPQNIAPTPNDPQTTGMGGDHGDD